jgi:endoglucanase
MLAATTPDSWAQMSPMALWTYAMAKPAGQDKAAMAKIRTASIKAAEQIVQRTRANPYHVSLRSKDYVWGSNGLAAQYGMQLLVTNALAPNPAFRAAAMDNLHYLLGRNTFSLSWVTQVGENPFRHPHHRPSVAMSANEPWPGLMSGGPNANRQDDVLKKLPEALPPAKVYVDDKESYASNEIAINWQAALAFLLAGQLD